MSKLKGTELVEKRNVLNELKANNMTLQEIRFFSIYLSKINARDISTRKVKFALSDFQKIMDLGRMNVQHVKQATDGLLTKLVHIKNERGGYSSFQLFKKCTVDYDETGTWYVEIDAHDEALPLMFDFKKYYFTYELWNVLTLSSKNQVRMYEILKQYEHIGKRHISLEELRAFLGIKSKQYDRWGDFKTYVLDACQKALAEKTDITFTYEPIRTGHKFTAVTFFIQKNENFVDYLKLEDYIDIACAETMPESPPKKEWIPLDPDTDDDTAEEIYGNKELAFLAQACDYEFSPAETRVLFDYLLEMGLVGSEKTIHRYRTLLRIYHQMNAASDIPEKDSPEENAHKRRFGFMKWFFKDKYELDI